MRTLRAEVAAAIVVGVDVGDGVLFQVFGVGFGPLSGTKQAFFFAVPAREDQGTLRLPARLQQVADAQGAGRLEYAEAGVFLVRRADVVREGLRLYAQAAYEDVFADWRGQLQVDLLGEWDEGLRA